MIKLLKLGAIYSYTAIVKATQAAEDGDDNCAGQRGRVSAC